MTIRRPWQAVDYAALERMYPPPPDYFERAYYAEPDEIERTQLARLRDRAQRAYAIPFHHRRWDAAGFDPRDLRSLDDLWLVPAYTVDDIRQSIEEHPPWGDYQGVTPADAPHEPMRVFMSGGTTGASRPTFYTWWDREVGGVLTARGLYMQGIRPGDVVLNSWSYGLHNGAFSFDEPLTRWLNCVCITASTGNVTSTRRQVELAREYGAAAILTTGDYLLRIADEARAMGLDPKTDLHIRSLATNIGDEQTLEDTFGVPCYSTYGFHEVQYVSVECPARNGLHIFEDAFIVQVVDPDTGEPLPDGETGALVVTELYKTGSAQIRYNIMDLSFLYPREQCACGSWLRRMGRFAGRGDNMIKLRGVNVWPEALGRLALDVPGTTPDYFVRAVRRGGRDELVLMVVSDAPVSEHARIGADVAERLKAQLGLRIDVDVVVPGSLDALTELATSPKPKRFRDERGGGTVRA